MPAKFEPIARYPRGMTAEANQYIATLPMPKMGGDEQRMEVDTLNEIEENAEKVAKRYTKLYGLAADSVDMINEISREKYDLKNKYDKLKKSPLHFAKYGLAISLAGFVFGSIGYLSDKMFNSVIHPRS